MEGKQPINYRISGGMFAILALLAGLADLLTLIPFVGTAVGPIFWVLATIYFWKVGLGLVNGRRLATTIISIVAELVPAVQAFPTILAGTIAVVIMTRIEDRTGISLTPAKKVGVTPPRNVRVPVNKTPGVRPPRIQGSV
jgi:hypothetical protein